jgi:hypothetical protein
MIRRPLPFLVLTALACVAGGSKSAPPDETPMPAAATDFCANAVELLGLSGHTLQSCTSMLPDQYYVTIAGDPGYSGPVVVKDGVPVAGRGCAEGAAWLTRIRVMELEVKSPVALIESLAWLGALPEGFGPEHFTDHEDRTGTTRFSANPFRLELRRDVATEAADGGASSSHGNSEPMPSQERSILTADTGYTFTWTLERRLRGGPWEPLSTTPCAP